MLDTKIAVLKQVLLQLFIFREVYTKSSTLIYDII